MEQCRNNIEELIPVIIGGIDINPTGLHIFKLFSPSHSWKRFSYLRQTRIQWRGKLCLPMESYWCGLGYGSWCPPFKVFSGVIFGSAAQLIPSRRISTASMTSCLGHVLRKYSSHLTSPTKHHQHIRTHFGRQGIWLMNVIQHDFFFHQAKSLV